MPIILTEFVVCATKTSVLRNKRTSALLILATLSISPLLAVPSAFATPPVAFAKGDVFVGIGGGLVAQYSPTGTLKDTLDTTTGSSEDTGMCFQSSGDLLTTNWPGNSYGMSQFDNNGNLVNKAWAPPSTFTGHPESCAIDNSGDVYVGQTDGAAIYKFSSTGTLLNTYFPTAHDRGIDWLDLAADQCTIYYNGEGSTVRTFNVCTNTQGPDFASGLASPCFALRILPGGDVLTACFSGVYHLSNTGSVISFFPASTFSPPESQLFALNIDPDGTSFWTAGYSSGNIYHIDIASGTQLGEFNAAHTTSVAGLAIFGEQTQGCTTGCGTTGVPEFGTPALLVTALGMLSLVLFRRMRTPLPKAS